MARSFIARGELRANYEYVYELDLNNRLTITTTTGHLVGECDPFPPSGPLDDPLLNHKIITSLVHLYIAHYERGLRQRKENLTMKKIFYRHLWN